MPTRKIKDFILGEAHFRPCKHPEHNPPSMMVYEPGEWEHECPSCQHATRFNVFPTNMLSDVRPSVRMEPLGSERHVFYVDICDLPPESVPSYLEGIQKTIRDARRGGDDLFVLTRREPKNLMSVEDDGIDSNPMHNIGYGRGGNRRT